MKKSRMFDIVDSTWNPLGGKCPHNCVYCWSMGEKGLVKKWNMKKYCGKPRLIEKEMKKQFKAGEFIFVCDMCDLFAEAVPDDIIAKVITHTVRFPQTTFLFLTKNPKRYNGWIFPENVILGATIESNRDYPEISKAPLQFDRVHAMTELKHRKMISIEPILDFDLDDFLSYLQAIAVNRKLEFIYVGFDNYNYGLPEPPIRKVEKLLETLFSYENFAQIRLKDSVYKRLGEVCKLIPCTKLINHKKHDFGRESWTFQTTYKKVKENE